jgi:predicted metalloprotease with PDZ domain
MVMNKGWDLISRVTALGMSTIGMAAIGKTTIGKTAIGMTAIGKTTIRKTAIGMTASASLGARAAAALLWTGPARAAQAAATTPAAPLLQDVPYPGTLSVAVDLRASARKIFTVHESIPVKAGALTLRYPEWIPGEHSPSGTIDSLTSLKITAGGTSLPWRRDLEDMYALHLDVPAGTVRIDLDFQFLSPMPGGSFGQSPSATPRLAELEWNQVAFYPAGYPVRQIMIEPAVTVPAGWQYATALTPVADQQGGAQFAPVSFDQLVDSPLFTGQFVRRIDLAPGAAVPVHLNVFGDRAENVDVSAAQVQRYAALIRQAVALFGSQHYAHYDFLFAVSDNTGHFGLEHHESSDDRINADFFTDPAIFLNGAGLLPHEYVHSWNGKFRRPAGLATADYNIPMQGELLWVYEGLTEYLGNVLTARSGLWSAEQYRDELAITAAQMDHRPGRTWRSLQDTADAAQRGYYAPRVWGSSRRLVDYYPEGELIWLDVDTTIRALSHNTRSLDDFARAFFGIDNGSIAVVPYRFEDLVAALEAVQPNDWTTFLRTRLDSHEAGAPLGGLRRAGWTLVYNGTPSPSFKAQEKARQGTDWSYSLGFTVKNKESAKEPAVISDVIWGSPAFDAGFIPGMEIIAVGGQAYTVDVLDAAVDAAQQSHQPIDVLVANTGVYSTLHIVYDHGPQFPHLGRLEGTPDGLAAITQARK